jgi:hypothetical protein
MTNILIRRNENGIVEAYAEIEHIKVHSLTHYEVGYGGSGPADLALSILNSYLKSVGYGGGISIYGPHGTACYKLAWRLHQQFKERFIAPMAEEGGSISRSEIAGFLVEHGVDVYRHATYIWPESAREE